MTEAQLYQWLRGSWVDSAQCNATRIESWIGRGIPDVHWMLKGRELWTELKIITEGGKLKEQLKPEQSVWLQRHVRAGGCAWVVAREEGPHALYYAWWGGDALKLRKNHKYVHAGLNQLVSITPAGLLEKMLDRGTRGI